MSKIQLRSDTLENLMQLNPLLMKGEVILVFSEDNSFLNFKIGDGLHRFRQLSFVIDNSNNDYILNIGDFSSKDEACNYAARSEIAGNKKAAIIIFTSTGAAGSKLQGRIFQMVNGEDVAMQYLMWDKKLYRRNVTGATGVSGGGTNAFPWEETGAHKLSIEDGKLRILSYENSVISSVSLPSGNSGSSAFVVETAGNLILNLTDKSTSATILNAIG